jgi:hypothetical protein
MWPRRYRGSVGALVFRPEPGSVEYSPGMPPPISCGRPSDPYASPNRRWRGSRWMQRRSSQLASRPSTLASGCPVPSSPQGTCPCACQTGSREWGKRLQPSRVATLPRRPGPPFGSPRRHASARRVPCERQATSRGACAPRVVRSCAPGRLVAAGPGGQGTSLGVARVLCQERRGGLERRCGRGPAVAHYSSMTPLTVVLPSRRHNHSPRIAHGRLRLR